MSDAVGDIAVHIIVRLHAEERVVGLTKRAVGGEDAADVRWCLVRMFDGDLAVDDAAVQIIQIVGFAEPDRIHAVIRDVLPCDCPGRRVEAAALRGDGLGRRYPPARPRAVVIVTSPPASTVTSPALMLWLSFIEYCLGEKSTNGDISLIALFSNCRRSRYVALASGDTSVNGLPESHMEPQLGHCSMKETSSMRFE